MSGGSRRTRQRTAIWELMRRTDEFRTAQQVHRSLSEQGEEVGLATVYRALQALADAAQVDVWRTPDGEAAYRLCATRRHHHHLICRGCSATVELETDLVEAWANSIGAEHGYQQVDHDFELSGVCPSCAE